MLKKQNVIKKKIKQKKNKAYKKVCLLSFFLHYLLILVNLAAIQGTPVDRIAHPC